MVERIIVHKHLYPALHQYPIPENIKDQFAFRPTGSTTAAIIDLLQQTSNMLLNNDFVVIVSTDFSKAFDTVSHQAMFDKMGSLDLPDEIYNWMVSYYSNRSHVTRYLGSTSGVAYINASIVQGSGFGPPSYIVAASDLHSKHECNVIVKFADDTYLLVGSNHLSTATEKFEHISAWAMENNLRLNPNKTRELIVVRKGQKSITLFFTRRYHQL